MAKAFSDNEKSLIKEKLLEGAIECIKKYGVKKTTVDELASYAGISKGAFYLFYDIKEKLFYDAVMENHNGLQNNLLASLEENKGNLTIDTLTEIIYCILKQASPFWTALFLNGDLDYIYRKLPKELVEAHHSDDLVFGERFFAAIPLKDDCDISVFTAALRAVFSTMLNVKNIGEEVYDQTVKVLIKGVLIQFLKVE